MVVVVVVHTHTEGERRNFYIHGMCCVLLTSVERQSAALQTVKFLVILSNLIFSSPRLSYEGTIVGTPPQHAWITHSFVPFYFLHAWYCQSCGGSGPTFCPLFCGRRKKRLLHAYYSCSPAAAPSFHPPQPPPSQRQHKAAVRLSVASKKVCSNSSGASYGDEHYTSSSTTYNIYVYI